MNITKRRIFTGVMYSMTCIESVQGHFDLRLIKSICFRENSLCAENDFYIFVSVDLDS